MIKSFSKRIWKLLAWEEMAHEFLLFNTNYNANSLMILFPRMHKDNNLLGKVLSCWQLLKFSCLISFFILSHEVRLLFAWFYETNCGSAFGLSVCLFVCFLSGRNHDYFYASLIYLWKKFFNCSFTRWYGSDTNWAQFVPHIFIYR